MSGHLELAHVLLEENATWLLSDPTSANTLYETLKDVDWDSACEITEIRRPKELLQNLKNVSKTSSSTNHDLKVIRRLIANKDDWGDGSKSGDTFISSYSRSREETQVGSERLKEFFKCILDNTAIAERETLFQISKDKKDLTAQVLTKLLSGGLAHKKYLDRILLSLALPDHIDYPPAPQKLLGAIYALIHSRPGGSAALCLSGGGIRSATFALGLIQGLARHKMLESFDYLSTVSGGGYTGSWLTAWLRRPTPHDKAFDSLGLRPSERKNGIPNPDRPEPGQIKHLRRFRNYLSPNLSLISADAWTLLATYFRNLFLNWLVLVPLLIFLCAVPRMAVLLISKPLWPSFISENMRSISELIIWSIFTSGAVLTIVAIRNITRILPLTGPRDGKKGIPQKRSSCEQDVIWRCLIPLLVASFLLTWAWALLEIRGVHIPDFAYPAFGAIIHLMGFILGISRRPAGNTDFKIIFWAGLLVLLTGAAGGGGAYLAATGPLQHPDISPHFFIVFSAPILLTCFLLGADILVGLYSRWQGDAPREWKARLNAFVLRICAIWVIVSALVLYGPNWLSAYPSLISSMGGLSGLIALLLGFSAKTKAATSADEKATVLDSIRIHTLTIAAPLTVGFLIVLISWCTSALILKWGIHGMLETAVISWANIPGWTHFTSVARYHTEIVTQTSLVWLAGLMAVCAAVGIVMGSLIDINKFSLHALYRDRLIRTFLGASNPSRDPDCFTGLDESDNLPLKHEQYVPTKLFHVINTAVNLLQTKDTAWSSRKAASFTMTPLHCGSCILGYRDSSQYAQNKTRGKLSLGTALAISGAAASPNMGYHSSAAVTVLMTLFNVRLGWWLGHPGEPGERMANEHLLGEADDPAWQRSTPVFAPLWWMKEALGQTREDNAYVYLSDGGHFENLGLYEMVLRRCRFIIVSDAGCDPTHNFENLGNAIRKIRVDFGIDIEIDLGPLTKPNGVKFTQWHLVIGTIRYDMADASAPVGTLIYVKASLTGDEPADVLEYASRHSDFPHQTTGDQFFDEAQFESYRQLGEHIAREIFRPTHRTEMETGESGLGDSFHDLRARWVTHPPEIRDSFLKMTESFVRLENKLRTDTNLSRFDTEIYPEIETILGGPPPSELALGSANARLHFCMQTIQLMEDVFLAVQLDKYHAHPLNTGWMNFFRRLTGNETLRKLWPSLKSSFSTTFVKFAEYQLNLYSHSDPFISDKPLADVLREKVTDEFNLEWPRAHHQAARTRLAKMLEHSDSSIVLSAHPSHLAKGKDDIWGVAGAYIPSPDSSNNYELNVWVRGAHRGVGIGSSLLNNLIEKLARKSGTDYLTVTAHLPALQSGKPGYKLEKAGWLEFFLRKEFVLKEETTEHYSLTRTIRKKSI